jgi:hypothetical protein
MVKKVVLKQGPALVEPLYVKTVFACRWFNVVRSQSLVTRQFPCGPTTVWLYSLRNGFVFARGDHGWCTYRDTDLSRVYTYGVWV